MCGKLIQNLVMDTLLSDHFAARISLRPFRARALKRAIRKVNKQFSQLIFKQFTNYQNTPFFSKNFFFPKSEKLNKFQKKIEVSILKTSK